MLNQEVEVVETVHTVKSMACGLMMDPVEGQRIEEETVAEVPVFLQLEETCLEEAVYHQLEMYVEEAGQVL